MDDDEPVPVMFVDHCTGDHLVKRDTADDNDGLPVDTSALVMIDKATGWIAVYPAAAKSIEAMQPFASPMDKIKKLYCDNAP